MARHWRRRGSHGGAPFGQHHAGGRCTTGGSRSWEWRGGYDTAVEEARAVALDSTGTAAGGECVAGGDRWEPGRGRM
jgi:hypothetical protein